MTVPVSSEDKQVLQTLRQTTRCVDGRYEVGLLWRDAKLGLPDNSAQALRWFLALEKGLTADSEFTAAYNKTIGEYVTLGHAKLVTTETNSGAKERAFFLPHHGVRNPNKPGKVRLVLDASAKFNGISLNDRLLRDPDLLTSLNGVLIRFRQRPVPVSANIERMFHQVRVAGKDKSALRFYWRAPGSNEPPQDYEMQVHVSPTICMFALRQTVEDNQREFPDLLSRVKEIFYVDNYLDSFETTSDAIAKSKEMSDLLAKGGFKIGQWGSSSKAVFASDPGTLLSNPSLNLDLDELPTE